MEWIPTHMPAADDLTNRLFLSLQWKSHLSGHFPRTAHIILQEMRALKLDLRRLCIEDLPACRAHRRILVGVDSRVVCGAASKGR